MRPNTTKVKSAAILAGAALIPTAAVFMSGLISNAIAGSESQNMNVSANVNSSCKFPSSANNLAFGAYDPIYTNVSANLDASTTFDVKCTKGASVTLKLGLGANVDSGIRRLKLDTNNFLQYYLYSDAGRTSPWDDDTNVVSYTASSSATQTKTIYGRIPSGQDVAAGSYSDTVVITASF